MDPSAFEVGPSLVVAVAHALKFPPSPLAKPVGCTNTIPLQIGRFERATEFVHPTGSTSRIVAPFLRTQRNGHLQGEKAWGAVSAPFGGSDGLVCLDVGARAVRRVRGVRRPRGRD
jgi:hypothetical protein